MIIHEISRDTGRKGARGSQVVKCGRSMTDVYRLIHTELKRSRVKITPYSVRPSLLTGANMIYPYI
jgi:hypothetical protein